MKDANANNSPGTTSRRQFCRALTMSAMVGVASSLSTPRYAQALGSRGSRTLLRGGTVISMDRTLGDFEAADVLIEGSRIEAVGRGLRAEDARVIPAENMIVMPGFIDTHRHMWQGQLRNSSPSGKEYLFYRDRCGLLYRPEDAYIGETVSILSALDAGVTTVLDWSHIQNTPEHTDAVIRALQNGGIRAVFAYGWPMPGSIPWWENSSTRYPADIKRLRRDYFASSDQLLTLAMGPTSKNHTLSALEKNPEQIKREWALAREVGARISLHTSGRGNLMALAKSIPLGPDTTYVHCRRFSHDEFKMIADSGGTVSLCPSLDTLQGRGLPPIQEVLDCGIRPSLSVDEEMDAPNDMFTQMRLTLSLQRGLLGGQLSKADPDITGLLSARDVLEFATIEGARANGLEKKTGSLTPGKEADVILLRKDRINVLPVNDPVGAVVLAMDTGNVDSVFVAGKVRKLGGQLVGVDLKSVADRAIRSRRYLGHCE